MIKSTNGDIVLDGSGEDLLLEATSIVIRVVQALVEEDCVDPQDVPKIITNITQLLTVYTQDLIPNKSTKYN